MLTCKPPTFQHFTIDFELHIHTSISGICIVLGDLKRNVAVSNSKPMGDCSRAQQALQQESSSFLSWNLNCWWPKLLPVVILFLSFGSDEIAVYYKTLGNSGINNQPQLVYTPEDLRLEHVLSWRFVSEKNCPFLKKWVICIYLDLQRGAN